MKNKQLEFVWYGILVEGNPPGEFQLCSQHGVGAQWGVFTRCFPSDNALCGHWMCGLHFEVI